MRIATQRLVAMRVVEKRMNEHAIQLLIDGELGPVETDRLLAY